MFAGLFAFVGDVVVGVRARRRAKRREARRASPDFGDFAILEDYSRRRKIFQIGRLLHVVEMRVARAGACGGTHRPRLISKVLPSRRRDVAEPRERGQHLGKFFSFDCSRRCLRAVARVSSVACDSSRIRSARICGIPAHELIWRHVVAVISFDIFIAPARIHVPNAIASLKKSIYFGQPHGRVCLHYASPKPAR